MPVSWLSGGVPPLRPIALLLALGSGVPSGSLLPYRFESSRWSPCRVESVSVLDRYEGSYYTFLVFGRNLRDEVTLTGRVFLRSRSERTLFEHLP